MSDSPSHAELGELIAGRYRVQGLLGRGGLALVYRAVDDWTGNALALKRYHVRDPRTLAYFSVRLEREYHTLSELVHPRIARAYDYGSDARGPYYTRELLDGSRLERGTPLPWREVCRVLCDIGSALALLHSRGFVHRDVSLRTVQHAQDGHVKLSGFGALQAFGVAQGSVGKPAFIAPEALQLQTLDARVDIFSLGALAYRLLTGRDAFVARRVSDLRDAWRSRPQPPHMIARDVPVALSKLVLRMLALDRAGRPQSVGEIIASAGELAGIEPPPLPTGARTALTTPALVGRDGALVELRLRVLNLLRSEGGVLVVRGAAGSGRSRLLDSCALEGKLLGILVVRADRRDAAAGEWGVARAIGQQLLQLLPERGAEAARLSREVLQRVLELRPDTGAPALSLAPPRAVLIRELRDWTLAVIKQQRLLLIVDDIDRIDDASLSFVSALVHGAAHHQLLIAASIETSEVPHTRPALRLLEGAAHCLDATPLTARHTEQLLRSLFGSGSGVERVAALIHARAHGSPRSTLAFARHLVDSGRARYAASGWSLPDELADSDLPPSLSAWLEAQLNRLSPDARELAEVLALAEDDGVELAAYSALTAHGEPRRSVAALNELCGAGILAQGSDRYGFALCEYAQLLRARVPAERRAPLHTRIARWLAAHGGADLRRVHHLLHAGLEADALELLGRIDLTAQLVPVGLLRRALEAAERLDYPKRTLHRLRVGIVEHAPACLDFASMRAALPLVLAQLEADSGLARYRQLTRAPKSERLAQALSQTHEAYLAAPEHERVHDLRDALRELARLCRTLTSWAGPVWDAELLERLPDLEPLFPLSPALPVVAQLVAGGKAWVRGHTQQGFELFQGVLERIHHEDRAGFDEAAHERMRLNLEYVLGFIEANFGMARAEQRARLLEQIPAWRVHAWRVRTLLHLATGNLVEAHKQIRRVELWQSQQGALAHYGSTLVSMELQLFARIGDVEGVVSSLRTVSEIAREHRGFRPIEQLGQSRLAELRGAYENALTTTRAALSELPTYGHPFAPSLAASEVRLLGLLGQRREAAARADYHLERVTPSDLTAGELMLESALAFGRIGRVRVAGEWLDELIRAREALGCAGIFLGSAYEARARIAIWSRDRASFEHYADKTRREFEKANNPNLSARLSQLYAEGFGADVVLSPSSLRPLELAAPITVDSQLDAIQARLDECVDRDERARCALSLLLQATHSPLGFLFAVDADASLSLLASLPETDAVPPLQAWLSSCVAEWLASPITGERRRVASEPPPAAAPAADRYLDAEGREFQATLLVRHAAGSHTLVAVVAQQLATGDAGVPPERMRRAVARALREHGDVTGLSARES